MDVDWNEEEKHDLGFTLSGHAGGNTLAAAMAVGSRAVDLVRARGGTMTAERVEETLVAVTQANQPRAALRDLLGQHITAQGATAATLQAKVEELEEERGKDAERIRDIERAKNLADHLYNEEHEAKIALRAEVERLEARTWIQCTVISNDCLGGCRSLEEHDRYRHQALLSEGDRLKDNLESAREDVATNQRVIAEEVEKRMAAESRLAAIREIVLKMRKAPRGTEETADTYDRGFGDGWVARGAKMRAELDALEGASPNHSPPLKRPTMCSGDLDECSAGCPWHGVGGSPQEAKTSTVIGFPVTPDIVAAMDRTAIGLRYPCSPTCTHEDAANPGHPERVKERSEAFNGDADVCEHRVDRRDVCGDCEYGRGKEAGAEAMRAAMLIEAKAACDQHGVGWLYQHLKRRFESAVEGTVP